jgi:hypothetical protein
MRLFSGSESIARPSFPPVLKQQVVVAREIVVEVLD